VWNAADDSFYFKKNSKIFEKISSRVGISMQEIQKEFRRRVQLLYELQRRNIFGFEEVQNIITEYYKKPENVLRKFGIQ
jgi:hypothetical protein